MEIYPLHSIIHLFNNWSQVSVVQKLDNTIHHINLYPVHQAIIGFPNTYIVSAPWWFIHSIVLSSIWMTVHVVVLMKKNMAIPLRLALVFCNAPSLSATALLSWLAVRLAMVKSYSSFCLLASPFSTVERNLAIWLCNPMIWKMMWEAIIKAQT